MTVVNNKPGKLIVICGIDGSGKTTLEEHIANMLRNNNIDYLITKQPSDYYRQHPEVRRYLDTGQCGVTMETLAVLSASDRMIHMDKVIEPALAQGKWVICNRYVYSAYAYFSARGVDLGFVQALNSKVREPDYGLLIDLPAAISCERVRNRDGDNSKFEEKNVEFMEGVRQTLIDIFPKKYCKIDGTLPENIVAQEALETIYEFDRTIATASR